MDYENFLKNVTLDRLEKAMERIGDGTRGPAEKNVKDILALDDDLKVAFITRGMMYICMELEFNLDGHDMWDACSFYTKVINTQSSGVPGTEYFE